MADGGLFTTTILPAIAGTAASALTQKTMQGAQGQPRVAPQPQQQQQPAATAPTAQALLQALMVQQEEERLRKEQEQMQLQQQIASQARTL